jgi:triosephosphate isomerase
VKILAGNWKLYKNKAECAEFFSALKSAALFPEKAALKHILCTSPTLMDQAVRTSEGLGIEIFSQNCSWAANGAFTGEISPLQIKDCGATGTLVGHSERRQFFGDTDATVLKRAACALEAGLKVIYCVGESLEERKSGQTLNVLTKQVDGLRRELLPHTHPSQLMVAYEPVWAIGTGLVAETPQIKEAHQHLKAQLELSGTQGWHLLYGGSVKPENLRSISEINGVNGALVGGASLDPQSFLKLRECLV